MRDITFRGRRTDNDKWVEGFFLTSPEFDNIGISVITAIDPRKPHYVWKETVGQYTGLLDKDGKKIFEGDIVKFGDMLGIINFGFGCYCVRTNKPDWKYRNNPAIDIIFNEYPNEIEVIGNINDNPELLEVK